MFAACLVALITEINATKNFAAYRNNILVKVIWHKATSTLQTAVQS